MTIGLQQSQYTVVETADYQFVCAEVQSGSVAGRDIEIDYTVHDAGMFAVHVEYAHKLKAIDKDTALTNVIILWILKHFVPIYCFR